MRRNQKNSGNRRKANPSLSAGGKRVGRSPAEESRFSFKYSIRKMRKELMYVCVKKRFVLCMDLDLKRF